MHPFAGEAHHEFDFDGGGAAGALLVHGFMGTPAELRPLGRALAAAGVSARGVLLPGFGPDVARLRRTRAVDWLRVATDAWLEVLARHERAVLIGYSMGGAIAVHLAAVRPPTRLVLVAPLTRLGDRRAALLPLIKRVVPTINPLAKTDFRDPGVRQFFLGRDPTLDLDRPAVQARLRRETELSTAVLDELRRVSARSVKLAPTVAAPTLVVQGRRDETVAAGDTRRLAVRLGGRLTLREVESGHQLIFDGDAAWPEVRDAIVRFATEEPA